MQEKTTLYLAGKITGDPFYFSKFYEAQKKLEKGGFIVVNPALLPSEGFAWEAYMRMAGAMLDECAAACFLPNWIDSKGAQYEFGRATAAGKRVFFFAEWEKAEEGKPKYIVQTDETDKIAFKCLWCGKLNVFSASRADGHTCTYCGGQLRPIGYDSTRGGNNAEK